MYLLLTHIWDLNECTSSDVEPSVSPQAPLIFDHKRPACTIQVTHTIWSKPKAFFTHKCGIYNAKMSSPGRNNQSPWSEASANQRLLMKLETLFLCLLFIMECKWASADCTPTQIATSVCRTLCESENLIESCLVIAFAVTQGQRGKPACKLQLFFLCLLKWMFFF